MNKTKNWNAKNKTTENQIYPETNISPCSLRTLLYRMLYIWALYACAHHNHTTHITHSNDGHWPKKKTAREIYAFSKFKTLEILRLHQRVNTYLTAIRTAAEAAVKCWKENTQHTGQTIVYYFFCLFSFLIWTMWITHIFRPLYYNVYELVEKRMFILKFALLESKHKA